MPTHDHEVYYGIQSEAVRFTWAGYYLFVLLSSLIGDSTILIASVKYRAFKLHKVITAIIQHIAVCDLMVCVMDIFPRLVSVLAGEWLLGNFLCYLSTYARYYFNPASVLLICGMTTSKLIILKYPLRSGTIKQRTAHKVCVTCWLAALTIPVSGLIVDGNDVEFSDTGYQCSYRFSSASWHFLKLPIVVIFLLIPIVLVISNTIYLLIKARRPTGQGRELRNWQGTMTTILTATIYCISIFPSVLHALPHLTTMDQKQDAHFYRLASSFLALNTISNFYIYCLTVPSFRKFIRSRILGCVGE